MSKLTYHTFGKYDVREELDLDDMSPYLMYLSIFNFV